MLRNAVRNVSLVALFALALAPACGDSADDSTKIPVDSSKAVNDLSQSEATEVCEAGIAIMKNFSEPACSFAGVAAKESGGNCEQVKSQCLSQLNSSANRCTDVQPVESDVNCDVTVGEVQTCLDTLAKAIDDALPDVTCSSSLQELQNMTQGTTPTDAEQLVPQGCKDIAEKCPDLNMGLNTSDIE